MGSIDDMKKKIKVDDIDLDMRKKLFNDLVEKGGKVVGDKKNKPIQFNRDKQRLIQKQQNKKREELKTRKSTVSQKTYTRTPTSTKSTSGKTEKKKKYSFQVFIQGLFSKVFTFTRMFNKGFTSEMHETFNHIFNMLNQISTLFLSLKQEEKWVSFDDINNTSGFAYEIMIRINSMVEKSNYIPIVNYFDGEKSIKCPDIVPNMFIIIKELVILYPSWEIIKSILYEGERIYTELSEIPLNVPRSKINKAIDKLFNYFLPRMFIIVVYNKGLKVKSEYNEMFKLVKISTDEDMGSITKDLIEEQKTFYEELKKEQEKAQKKEQEEADKKEEKPVPKYIQTGLRLIDAVIKKIPSKNDRDKTGSMFEEKEKMLHFYYVLHAFDARHSFIMTTTQIDFEPIIEEGVRIDPKMELEKMNRRFNEILSIIKSYIKTMEDYHYVNNDKKLKPHLKEQQINNYNKTRTKLFTELKAKTSAFCKGFAVILQKLIKDYDGEKRLIENPDDYLRFHSAKNIKHYFENATVIKAILVSFSYSSAFYHYLNSNQMAESGLYFKEDKPLDTATAQDTPQDKPQNTPQDKPKEEPQAS